MSKKAKTRSTAKRAPVPGFSVGPATNSIASFTLRSNGLTVLYAPRPGTGVVTTNLTYSVGSRDELPGETGLAHMLEHMLFKPTTFDRARKWSEARAMRFEKATGCILNANTSRDRTTYFFNYPQEHLDEALAIEAERMTGVILTDPTLRPEQGNVLNEYDMYNGDPYFALEVAMHGAAFLAHPYGHETIGHRADIEAYTAVKLERFYRDYYRPDNAVLQIIGDVSLTEALTAVQTHFAEITRPETPIPRRHITEPPQEGLRRTTIERPTNFELFSLGFKHAGFPNAEWWQAALLVDILTDGPESVLHRALVDTGLASSVSGGVEETPDPNLGTITVTLAEGVSQSTIEATVRQCVAELDRATVTARRKSVQASTYTDLLFAREGSLSTARLLTECIAGGDWSVYEALPELVLRVTTADIMQFKAQAFRDNNLTIGHCVRS